MVAEVPSPESSVHEKLRSFTTEQQEAFEEVGLAFWFFPSMCDGVDIKAEFKARLEGVEGLLSEEQRAEVVAEAREVFVRCEALVAELDEVVGRQGRIVDGERRHRKRVGAGIKEKGRGWAEKALEMGRKIDIPGYAACALVISSVSWYMMYHSGSWYAA
jgi:hypothetical protein